MSENKKDENKKIEDFQKLLDKDEPFVHEFFWVTY